MKDNRPLRMLTRISSRLRGPLSLLIPLSLSTIAALWRLSPWRSDTWIGIAIFVVVVLGIAALAVDWSVREWTKRHADYRTIRSPDILRGSHLDQVVALGRKAMGDGHAGAETLRARLSRCPSGVVVLMRRPHRSYVSETVVGYFVCWTISSSATARFLSGEYTSGLDLCDDDIVVEGPASAYITMLLGVDRPAKDQIKAITASHLTALFGAEPTLQHLLARPATDRGEALMKEAGMVSLNVPNSNVWMVNRELILSRLASGVV